MEEDADEQEHLAMSLLIFMVRWLFCKQFPYVQFPCNSLHGYGLYDIFLEVVEWLERCGFNVLACTYDGLSVNSHFFKMHSIKEFIYKVVNPYSDER